MEDRITRSIYDIWANFYDALFWRGIVTRRSTRAIAHMNIQPGECVLDIGGGAGLALPAYPSHAEVTGIDLSEGMLKRAHDRAIENKWSHVKLSLGNALQLPFEAETFDYILLSHVITVVSDPVKLIEEIRRVARPGASVVIINHFQSSNRLVAFFERIVNPICVWLGWKSDLSLEDLIRRTGLEVEYRYKLDPLDLFQTVFAKLRPGGSSAHIAAA